MRKEIRFLSVDNVTEIHNSTIQEEGGSPGLRDRNLLESAVAMPQASFGGEYVHSDLASMAAAYLFYLCQNHPFIDGNKRASAFSTLIFLSVNGIPDEQLPDEAELEKVTLSIASSAMTKEEAVEWIRAVLKT